MRAFAGAVKRAQIQVLLVTIGLALIAVVGSSRTPANDVGLAGGTFPNVPFSGLYACKSNVDDTSAACIAGALKDFNRARAAEGIGPMRLPSNYTSLTLPGKLLVLANLDRVARHLTPISGISSTLNNATVYGANHASDPAFPSYAREGGSNWAGTVNPFWSEFLWVYDDGPGGTNSDCTQTNTSGCWGHRRNILSAWEAPITMGASQGTTGTGQLILGLDTRSVLDGLRWSSVVPLLPNLVSSLLGAPSVPGMPGRPGATVRGRYVTLTWSAAAAHGAAVKYYRIRTGTRMWQTTARTIRVLVAPGVRTFRVRAVNRLGAGPFSYGRTVTVR